MNITKKLTAFYQHLNAADVSRTIFSVKWVSPKTQLQAYPLKCIIS